MTEAEWAKELEKGGRVEITEERMVIDVPGGATVWYRPELSGPVEIAFTAVAVSAGGANDRVSDLNVFWMARENDGSSPIGRRGGKFREYDTLRMYYASFGGNANTTTRFRRYIGEADNRPLLPEHDLRAAEFLLTPNVPTRIRLVADGSRVEVWRDGRRVFEFVDAEPYTSGRFAFRTVASHLRVSALTIGRPGGGPVKEKP